MNVTMGVEEINLYLSTLVPLQHSPEPVPPTTRMIPQGGRAKVPINEKFLSNLALHSPFPLQRTAGNQSGFASDTD